MIGAAIIPAIPPTGKNLIGTKLLYCPNTSKHKNVSHTEPDVYTPIIKNISWTKWLAFLRTFPIQDGVRIATRKLYDVCDGALSRDHLGYCRYDARMSRKMVDEFGTGDMIHPDRLKKWFLRLTKYRKQLIRLGILYPDICFEGVGA